MFDVWVLDLETLNLLELLTSAFSLYLLSCPPKPMSLIKGRRYTWSEIMDGTGADGSPPYYLPHRDGEVVAGCFTLELNPEAPRWFSPAKSRSSPSWPTSSARRPVPSRCVSSRAWANGNAAGISNWCGRAPTWRKSPVMRPRPAGRTFTNSSSSPRWSDPRPVLPHRVADAVLTFESSSGRIRFLVFL